MATFPSQVPAKISPCLIVFQTVFAIFNNFLAWLRLGFLTEKLLKLWRNQGMLLSLLYSNLSRATPQLFTNKLWKFHVFQEIVADQTYCNCSISKIVSILDRNTINWRPEWQQCFVKVWSQRLGRYSISIFFSSTGMVAKINFNFWFYTWLTMKVKDIAQV